MNIFKKIINYFKGVRFIEIEGIFLAKDELFELQFPDNWLYSQSGNSFYSFGNLKEDLKGNFEISIIKGDFYNDENEDIEEHWVNEHLIKETEEKISNYEAMYQLSKIPNSNLDFHDWYIITDKICIRISFMIFEEETKEVKDFWLNEVKKILNTLNINFDNILIKRLK